ncbi:hypothetical protein GGR52DRAFT_35701 [Hypoxylon sp. FL1284]|nr:hypothetical protein GGR52DRAFT_35701 [Hypoxylon sp. FL1284]
MSFCFPGSYLPIVLLVMPNATVRCASVNVQDISLASSYSSLTPSPENTMQLNPSPAPPPSCTTRSSLAACR